MGRTHAFILSLAIGMIAITGLFAAARTVGLGSHARAAADRQIAQRSAALDRYSASLRKALSQSAPKAAGAAPAAPPRPVKVVYHRPPPIVVTTHRAGEHKEAEGGGFDD
jgi:hypothetical protein